MYKIFKQIKTKNFIGMEFNNLKLITTNLYVKSPIHLSTFPKKNQLQYLINEPDHAFKNDFS